MSLWFALEVVVYYKHDGRLWLSDVLRAKGKSTSKILEELIWHTYFRKQNSNQTRLFPHPFPARIRTLDPNPALELSESPLTRIGKPRPKLSPFVSYPSKQKGWFADVDETTFTPEQRSRHLWHELFQRVLDQLSVEKTKRVTSFTTLQAMVRDGAIVSKLQRMTLSHTLDANNGHSATVRILEFSPDGKYLATSRFVLCWRCYEKMIDQN